MPTQEQRDVDGRGVVDGTQRKRLPSSYRWPCYKFLMKIIEQWLLFKYVEGQFTPLSKPFKSKAAAEKARTKYPERERRMIGVGVVRKKS
jgi:hypothetical protein